MESGNADVRPENLEGSCRQLFGRPLANPTLTNVRNGKLAIGCFVIETGLDLSGVWQVFHRAFFEAF
jgi:hypothetical protein